MSEKLYDPHKAVDYILSNAGRYAKAKAERVYLEEFRKSKKALLMAQSDAKTAVEAKAVELIAITQPREDELDKDIEAREAEVKAEKKAEVKAEKKAKKAKKKVAKKKS